MRGPVAGQDETYVNVTYVTVVRSFCAGL